jgi:hypothetical protein
VFGVWCLLNLMTTLFFISQTPNTKNETQITL